MSWRQRALNSVAVIDGSGAPRDWSYGTDQSSRRQLLSGRTTSPCRAGLGISLPVHGQRHPPLTGVPCHRRAGSAGSGGRIGMAQHVYKAKQFPLSGLKGISDRTLEMHFKLYEGYVKETNRLTEELAEFLEDGQVDQDEMPAYSELKRRLGFEYNGMVLHEYYFGNLKKGGTGDAAHTSTFHRAAEQSFGNYAHWKADFVGVGKMRGVGWAICYQDPTTGRLSN